MCCKRFVCSAGSCHNQRNTSASGNKEINWQTPSNERLRHLLAAVFIAELIWNIRSKVVVTHPFVKKMEADSQSNTPPNAFLITFNFSDLAMEIVAYLDLYSYLVLLQSSKIIKSVCDRSLAWRHYTTQFEAERSNKLRTRRRKKDERPQHASVFKFTLVRIYPQIIDERGQRLIRLLQNTYEGAFYSELFTKWHFVTKTAVRNKVLLANDAQHRCSHPTIGMLLNKTNYTAASSSNSHREYRLHVTCSECGNVCHDSCYVCCCSSSLLPQQNVGCVDCVKTSTFRGHQCHPKRLWTAHIFADTSIDYGTGCVTCGLSCCVRVSSPYRSKFNSQRSRNDKNVVNVEFLCPIRDLRLLLSVHQDELYSRLRSQDFLLTADGRGVKNA
jgi:hypothetical protein